MTRSACARAAPTRAKRMRAGTSKQSSTAARQSARREPRLGNEILSHAPRALGTGREDPEDFLQALADALESVAAGPAREWQPDRFHCLVHGSQLLPRARDGVALVVKEFLDAQHVLEVALAVHALASAALGGLQLRELCFPEAQHVRRQAAQLGHFADAEVQLVGNQNFLAPLAVVSFRHGLFHGQFPSSRPVSSAFSSMMRAGGQLRCELRHSNSHMLLLRGDMWFGIPGPVSLSLYSPF